MQWLSEFLKYDFMKNALAAILIITPLFGILGTMIVNNKLAFFSDALGHSAFTGMAAGIILGVTNQGLARQCFERHGDIGILFSQYGGRSCDSFDGRQFLAVFLAAGGRYLKHPKKRDSFAAYNFCHYPAVLGSGLQ